jgi:hypothetical protein
MIVGADLEERDQTVELRLVHHVTKESPTIAASSKDLRARELDIEFHHVTKEVKEPALKIKLVLFQT